MIKGTFEERLRKLGLFHLKRWSWKFREISSKYKNAWRKYAKKREQGSFQWCLVTRPEEETLFYCEGDWVLAQAGHEGCGVSLHNCRYSKGFLWATSSRWLYLCGGLGKMTSSNPFHSVILSQNVTESCISTFICESTTKSYFVPPPNLHFSIISECLCNNISFSKGKQSGYLNQLAA